ncbi:MAG: two-component system response regulator [Fibrobacteres bacterium CG2_30_45_31]|nr:MAG: two-component system response regulator [Fibrobacteres bacterium CG2_30_45_31]
MIYSVLVVDDVPENIDVLKGMLTNEYYVKVAVSGFMALKVAEKTVPDIILLDIMMPDMDGYEVCEKLKANPITQNIPVIFVTAKDQTVDEIKGFEVGAVDYVTKPISPSIVKARLSTHLALSNQNRELERLVTQKTSEINQTRLEIIKRLSLASEYKDSETGHHIERMSQYAYQIAVACGMDIVNANLLYNAAPMHDIGKIGIPEAIILKPGRLTKEEFDVVKTHCEIGSRIIGDHTSELLKAAKIVALQHHEKWDGSGYPEGLIGDSIHVYAQIIAVADVFDALTSKRPYKEAWDFDRAVALIKEENGRHFSPGIVVAFLKILDEIKATMLKYYDH